MKKILITGSTGMLGSDLVNIFRSDDKYDVYGLSRSQNQALATSKQLIVDLALPVSYSDLDIRADIVIHTAALTDLGLCEREPTLAEQVHVQATQSLLQTMNRGGQFIYISTDSVFDGVKGNYSEHDEPNPLNVYAKTKLKGEHVVKKANHVQQTIVRTNIYGFHSPIKNSLAEWAFREWGAGKRIAGFSDTIFNAVYTVQLAEVLKFMLDEDIHYPIVNIGSDTAISKYDFLQKLGEELRVDPDLLVESTSDAFPSQVRKPKDTSLNVSLLSSFAKVPSFDAGIRRWSADVAFRQAN